MIRLRRGGLGAAAEERGGALRRDWARRSMVRLDGFLGDDLLALAAARLPRAAAVPMTGSPLDRRDVLREPALQGAFLFAFNDPAFLAFASSLLGARVRGFFGQFYRHRPGVHYLRWHGDTGAPRRLGGITVCLNEKPFRGGLFELRRAGGRAPLASASNTRTGDAVLFRIARGLQHRNTEVEGSVAKLTFSGWFFDLTPAELERRLAGRALK